MGSPGRKQAEIGSAVMVTGRSCGESQHGERGGRQPHSVPMCMGQAASYLSCNCPRVLGNHLCGFWSLCSQMDLSLLQILISLQAVLGKHKRKNIIWEKSGILQKVTFLERTLEPDVPLKSICGQGLCRETNCYKGKNSELQQTGYKKKLHQEKKQDWRRIY